MKKLKPVAPLIKRAVSILKAGGVVAFPTETVYGLGADAFNAGAVRKIFKAKGRPSSNPLIVHVADQRWLKRIAAPAPPAALKLMRAFWPGPLTLVLWKAKGVPIEVTAGLKTVAVRMPKHPLALKLLKAFGKPIAAPSANRSGRPSPTIADHVREDFGSQVMVLDGGACEEGLESTILDLTGSAPRILRPGAVTREQIEKVIGPVADLKGPDAARIHSPGLRCRHYAPRCRVVLFNLMAGEFPLKDARYPAGILCRNAMNRPVWALYFRRVPGSVKAYGRALFAALREAEKSGISILHAETVAFEGAGKAVMDRLVRAAQGSWKKPRKLLQNGPEFVFLKEMVN